MYGFFKRNCLGLQKFLSLTQSPLVFAARSCGDLSFMHWNHGLGVCWWQKWDPGVGQGCEVPPHLVDLYYILK